MSFELPGVAPNSDAEKLFKAVGFVVINWGMAEQHLDLVIVAIFHRFKGHPLLRRRPTTLSHKIESLQLWIKEIGELTQFKSEFDALLSRFKTTGKKRNDIVHGAIADFSADGGGLQFSKIDVVPNTHHSVRTVFLANSDWAALRSELSELARDSLAFARRVIQAINAPKRARGA